MSNQTKEVATTEIQADQGLMTAIKGIVSNPEMDVDKLEKMLDMQERVLDRQALIDFNYDMSLFQSDMPTVPKKGEIKVSGVVRSKYAKYEDILETARPYLEKYGFSISFKTNFENGVDVFGKLSHTGGHSEETSMLLPSDTSGSKNAVQAIGSTISYGKRYVLCMLLNIATGDDDDGHGAAEDMLGRCLAMAKVAQYSLASILVIKEGLAIEDYSAAKEAWNELTEDEQNALWIAPSKGGLFTTEEIKKIRSSEWSGAQ